VAKACVEADPSVIAGLRNVFKRRRDLVLKGLEKIPGWACNIPQGAFYVLPDVSRSFKGAITNSTELSMYLLDHAGVSLVEGDSFGAPGTVRISYATSDALLTEALDRIAKAIAALG
jgi:aspartate aminotransferase